MKREGRQHGMVRTYRILPSPWNPRPDTRFISRFDSPPTAGLFTKVQPRPTNHSKFTGKCSKPRCNECHVHPSSKSKDKTKGTQKLKSHDVLSNYRLMSWRVVDGKPGLNFSGFSASCMLDHMDDERYFDDEDEDCDEDDNNQEIVVADDDKYNNGIIDDDEMSYCDVGFVLDQVEGDEDWCLVAEL